MTQEKDEACDCIQQKCIQFIGNSQIDLFQKPRGKWITGPLFSLSTPITHDNGSKVTINQFYFLYVYCGDC